eukprot:5927216-Pleurochrysis_carterae.AAC.1
MSGTLGRGKRLCAQSTIQTTLGGVQPPSSSSNLAYAFHIPHAYEFTSYALQTVKFEVVARKRSSTGFGRGSNARGAPRAHEELLVQILREKLLVCTTSS